jgi:chemotaxis methyl-accepting protein methylase
MIYLDRNAQSTILKNFYDHLNPDGYLVIGKVELLIGIPEVELFNTVSRVEHVYQRKEMPL